MAKCPQCGKDVSILERDIFTGVCRQCQRIGARPASLGCGTLILIAIIVGLVTNSMSNEVRNTREQVVELQAAVQRLEKVQGQQLDELRAMRAALEARGIAPVRPK